MSLQVWLPLNGDLQNKGLSQVTITNTNAVINNNGKIGKSYQFGTSTSYLTLNKEVITNFTDECSVCFWIKILTWNTSYATFFQAGLGSTPWNNYIFGFLRNNANSNCCFTISNGSTSSQATYLTPNLELNTWYHIGLIYKTGHCLIYINGSLYQDYATSYVPNFANITTITLGTCNNKTSYQTNCLLNDFRLYDHALSLKEIKEISKGLVLHYPLDNIPLLDNCYSYPTFETSSANGGWSHWGATGANGTYGQNTNKEYIYNKTQFYSHWVANTSTATAKYLLYQSPAFTGGLRSLQCICKQEDGKQITDQICNPGWNARNGGVPNNLWTSIVYLGDGFYHCKCEGISQDGSNNLVGINVNPGYKVYFTCVYVENFRDKCSDIFFQNSFTIIQDCSGYQHDGIINNITYTDKEQGNLLSNSITNFSNWTILNSNLVSVQNFGRNKNRFTLIQGISYYENVYSPIIEVIPNTTYVLSCRYKVYSPYTYVQAYGGPFGLVVMDTKPLNSNQNSNIIARVPFSDMSGKQVYGKIEFTPTVSNIYLNINGGALTDGQKNLSFDINNIFLYKKEDENTIFSGIIPRYNYCASFNGSNSYVKINENNWMAQHAKQMTINLWAYAENWATQTKLFSCTESGGFNTQTGNSGYVRFPVYVCTNQAQTSYAYKYDSQELKISDLTSGWHMFTFIYDAATGTKTYVDGELHHTYSNVSYGIHFNTNARLFLGCEASSANPTTPYFNGKQSDFRLYYTVLSEADIKELYNSVVSITRNGDTILLGKFHQTNNQYNFDKRGISSFKEYTENESMNKNLFIGTAMNESDQSTFINNGSTDWTRKFRYYNGSTAIHTFTKNNNFFEDTVKLSSSGNLGIAFVRLANDIQLDSSSYYTISCEAKCTKSGAGLDIGLSYYNTSNTWVWRGGTNRQLFENINTWQKFTLTFKPDSDTQAICYCFTVVGTASGTDTFTIRKCKLEKGTEATKWILNENDNSFSNKKVKIINNDGLYSNSFIEN